MIKITYPANQVHIPKQLPLIKMNQDGSFTYPFFQKILLEKNEEKSWDDLERFLTHLLRSEGKYWDEIYPLKTRNHTLFFPIQSKIREILLHFSHSPIKVKQIYSAVTEGQNFSPDLHFPATITDVRFLDYKCRMIDYSTLVISFDNQQSARLTLRLSDKTISADHLTLTWS